MPENLDAFSPETPPEMELTLASDAAPRSNAVLRSPGGKPPGVPDSDDSNGRFAYELAVELEPSREVAVGREGAIIHCRFRHFHPRPIALRSGVANQLNLGFRLLDPITGEQLFEDRMYPEPRGPIQPGEWIGGKLQMPRRALRFEHPLELMLDMVKEEAFWFAAKAAEAYRIRISFRDALAVADAEGELEAKAAPPSSARLAFSEPEDADGRATPQDRSATAAVAHPRFRHNIVFDVSDLVQYFEDSRLPTGIQRVQIEIIGSLIKGLPADFSLKLACFTQASEFWTELPLPLFEKICKHALLSADINAPDWRDGLDELRVRTKQGTPIAFEPGTFLINLGTSWWLGNYFLNVRSAKAQHGIKYVPFVHDLIPIITPEHCVPDLVRQFVAWIIGVFHHADHIVVNSQSTAADLLRVSRYLGQDTKEPAIIRLDARFGRRDGAKPGHSAQTIQVLLRNGLRPAEYVLLVSTIEARKNHELAFSAWLTLCKRHGIAGIPKLACVGKRGWLNEGIYAKLASSPVLQEVVIMLANIPDGDLECLYNHCLFTIFPSHYEGWGLPITESLCYEKVPLISRSSSLPEAGGEFAEYFDLGSDAELIGKLERLIFDADYRRAREAAITAEFRPRSWTDISTDLVRLVQRWSAQDAATEQSGKGLSAAGSCTFHAQPGRFYPLAESSETRIRPGMVSAEIFRQDNGWWLPEPWGTWTRAPAARLAFFAEFDESAPVILFVGLRGAPVRECTATLRIAGAGARDIRLKPLQDSWALFRINADRLGKLGTPQGQLLFDILLSTDEPSDLSQITGGLDRRVVGLGVRGFMICAANDFASRLKLTESVALGDLDSLSEDPVPAELFT